MRAIKNKMKCKDKTMKKKKKEVNRQLVRVITKSILHVAPHHC